MARTQIALTVTKKSTSDRYLVKSIKNSTEWEPGQALTKRQVDQAIIDGVDVTIIGGA